MNETIIIGFLVGLLTGILANGLFWWILNHKIVPCLRFSPDISKNSKLPTQLDASAYSYRIKLENSGRRSIIDVEIIARLRFNSPSGHLPHNWHNINIPWTHNGDTKYQIPRLLPLNNNNDVRHILTFLINDIDEFRESTRYYDDIKMKANQRTLILEDILSLVPNATLQLIAFGYDEFSGVRKLFVSKQYTINDIKVGLFERNGLDVIENPENDMSEEYKLSH
jgi:hypothetical protein